MRITASSFTDPPTITNELHEARVLVLNDIEAAARRSLAHNRLKHIWKQNVPQNIIQCVCRPRIVSNASKNQEANCYAPKRPRHIQPVFLSKYRLLIALDTVFRRKRDKLARDWFLRPNLPETHFKVKRATTVFLRPPRSTASYIEEVLQPTLS
ncbi:hypothetical protein MRB53_010167 [Persea americana]|uniref:Uncharacterized protein n=1 Tax=Persea americana TaxID=3435 RepID=A0ACC2LRG6_PERAE|nr:hypothetical protein MRB53_010167 [Persea americana]